MNRTKLSLSAKETELINNSDWILTKNVIIRKTILLLEKIQEKQQQYLTSTLNHFPKEMYESSPKISKGENYKGLPYLVLDYPRVFDKKNILAIRTLFWWGNFFSITLHISGRYKEQYEEKLTANYSDLKKSGFWLCINKDEWEHHFEITNYIPLRKFSAIDFKKNTKGNTFIKLAKKYPVKDWGSSADKLTADFKKVTDILRY